MANGNMQPIDRITQLENLVLDLISILFNHKKTDEPAHVQLGKVEIPEQPPITDSSKDPDKFPAPELSTGGGGEPVRGE